MNDDRLVVMLCGLPASGKTTTAARLHARLGGALIRSCDVYQALGIDLPAWIRRTNGFTSDVGAYEAQRDGAYREMLRRIDAALGAGRTPVIVDAVHGEPDKRYQVYACCHAHGARAVLVWCRCDDADEVARRFAARPGRAHEPQNEAIDISVYHHIAGLWVDPTADPEVAAGEVGVVVVDTLNGRADGAGSSLVDAVYTAFETSHQSGVSGRGRSGGGCGSGESEGRSLPAPYKSPGP